MFFKALPWGNKDKTKVKVKVNTVRLTREFSSRFSSKKDRRASGDRRVSKDATGRVGDEAVAIGTDRADVRAAAVVDAVSPTVTSFKSGEYGPRAHSVAPTPELSSAAEASVDETLARLSSAFAAPVSDTFCDARSEPSADDYIFRSKLGDGAEGVVYLAIGRRDRMPYAVKAVRKAAIPKSHFGNIFTSQYAMKAVKGSPFIVDLQASFETRDHFMFVFPFYANGDLKGEMRKLFRAYSEAEARNRIAQLIVALESLHRQRIMHRDLKPENVLLNDQGDIILTDFGLCHTFGRPVEEQPWRVAGVPDWEFAEDVDIEGHLEAGGGDKTKLFAGTPNYMAPEVYGEDGDGWYSYAADIWSVGIMLFEMLHRKLPFGLTHGDGDEFDPMTCILYAPLIVDLCLSDEVHDLLSRLLERDPERRAGWDEIKTHPWFDEIDWDAVVRKEEAPTPLITGLDCLPPISEKIRKLTFGEPYLRGDAPFPYFEYVSPDHLQSISTSELYMGSPEWKPTPDILEGFGWPVSSPGNAFAMCPPVSSLPNLRKPFEVPSLGVGPLHASVHGSIYSAFEEEPEDDSSMCSGLAQDIKAGRVPGMYLPTRGSANSSFSRQSSMVFATPSRSASAQFTGHVFTSSVDRGDLEVEVNGLPAHTTTTVSDSSSANSEILLAVVQRALVVRVDATSVPLRHSVSLLKRSESIPLAETDVPSLPLSGPDRKSSSPESVVVPYVLASSDCSATMVGSTGAYTDLNTSTMTSKTPVNVDSSVGKASVSTSNGSFSSPPPKLWVRKAMGVVKGWFKPGHRRERRPAAVDDN